MLRSAPRLVRSFFLPLLTACSLAGCGSSSSSPEATSSAGGGGGAAGAGGAGGGDAGGAGSAGSAGAAGAGGSAGAGPLTASTVIGDMLPDTCNPLRSAGACLLPFPNAIYTVADAASPTGVRLALVKETLPVQAIKKIPLDPTRFNMADGFSPATPILAYFPEPLDPASLPPIQDPGQSLAATSATVIVDMTTNQLVAHFAEVDATVKKPSDRQTLILRPTTRLLPSHQYAVGITTSLKTKSGKTPASPPVFASILAGTPPSDAMSLAQAQRMPAVVASLAAAGVPTSNLLLAWDFVTASDAFLTSHLLSMRDQSIAAVGDKGAGYTITKVDEKPVAHPHVLRFIDGTVKVPQYLSDTDPTQPKAELSFDAQGLPAPTGKMYDVPFTVLVPAKAATQKLPLMLFGHGLLGSGPDYLHNIELLGQIADEYGLVMVATDWIGLSNSESPGNPNSNGAAAEALLDFNHIPWLTDRLQQSVINNIVLLRTTQGLIAQDPAMTTTGQAGGTGVLDGKTPLYFGISLGGIMGGTFMAYDPTITRGVLNVAGSTWSLMFQRSSNWKLFDLVISGSYPDLLDDQVLLALTQTQFDFTDPINAAPHWLSNPLPNTPVKQILQQMSVSDAQVPNIASEILARTGGLQNMLPTPLSVYGMTPVAGPLQSALTIWDTKPANVPPSSNLAIDDNGAHTGCISQPDAQKQIDHFLRTGEVISYCMNSCNPE